MTWKSLTNWLSSRTPLRQAQTPDPFYAERLRLQEQVTLLQGQLGKMMEMVREANANERHTYQSMCNTLGRAQFAAPPFPNAALAPGRVDEPMILESNVVNGSDEVDRMARRAKSDAMAAYQEFIARTSGNPNS